jgi:hypothetical protein
VASDHEARVPLYREVADVPVATDGRTPGAIAEAVLAGLAEARGVAR